MSKPALPSKAAKSYRTLSGLPLEPVYGPEHADPNRYIGMPGEYPYTRGIHETMYRGKLWTMRQFSGFATPEETNERYQYLLKNCQAGLSVAFDLPTLMGYDADDPASEGEVGKCGVAISSLEDMETLFRGIPLSDVTVSMTINSPAPMIWAMFLVVAEKQGVPWSKVNGTLQNDILKEYIAQKEYIYPPRPSMRLVTDTIEFAAQHTPKFNPISISGYHIREAGSTAAQELAFTLRDGIEYVDWAVERGLPIDEFAPKLSFFFNAHSDFFEEIAKYRAARRIWAIAMKERYGARDERSMKLRFHSQTAGCSLTWQQPYNNVVRTAIQGLAAVLGGTQSLHTNSLDEAYALPSEQAVTIALRTQQVIAHETGVPSVADPLGGSYFVEHLTAQIEEAANAYIRRIDDMGGMIPAIERNYPQSEIANSSFEYQQTVETGEQIIVGVNQFVAEKEEKINLLQIDETAFERQAAKLKALRARRNNVEVEKTLAALTKAAEGTENTMPYLMDCVRAYATLGEMCEALRGVFGTYTETSVI
ncbi:MAG: methylmalonyl-CoA mutase family protein [Bryobacteraceae bacterium]